MKKIIFQVKLLQIALYYLLTFCMILQWERMDPKQIVKVQMIIVCRMRHAVQPRAAVIVDISILAVFVQVRINYKPD